MKLRSKILSYTLPLILIPLIIMALATYYFIIRANQVQTDEETKRSLNEVIVNIGQEANSVKKDIEVLSKVPALAKLLTASSNNLSNGTFVKEEHEFFKTFIQKSKKATIALNEDLYVFDLSESAASIFGYSKEELIDSSSEKILDQLVVHEMKSCLSEPCGGTFAPWPLAQESYVGIQKDHFHIYIHLLLLQMVSLQVLLSL